MLDGDKQVNGARASLYCAGERILATGRRSAPVLETLATVIPGLVSGKFSTPGAFVFYLTRGLSAAVAMARP